MRSPCRRCAVAASLARARPAGNPIRYRYFTEKVWHPTLKAAKIVPRKFHSTRHTYAASLLSAGADIRFVADQFGHARITLTIDTHSEVRA